MLSEHWSRTLCLRTASSRRSNVRFECRQIPAAAAKDRPRAGSAAVQERPFAAQSVVDENGIDLDLIKEIKEVRRERISTYVRERPEATYKAGGNIWEVRCDVAFPCATQNELDGADARLLVESGCTAVVEGANMPVTPDGVAVFRKAGVLFAPGKAANAGGVATSALEMQQNAGRDAWTFSHTDARLKAIMTDIHDRCYRTAEEFGAPGNYVLGANIAGFRTVAEGVVALGVI